MTDPKPLKKHSSFQQQLDTLRGRGLFVGDEAKALATLERLGYYRLSGYFYPLRATKPVGEPGRLDAFQPGASFELVQALAEFDKRLRLVLMYAIESVELAVRVAIAHHLGKLDPQAHLNTNLLDGRFVKAGKSGGPSLHSNWLDRYNKLLTESKEDFVVHHMSTYGGRLPIWVGIEIWDFGLLSRFFAGMQFRDRNRLAAQFGAFDGEVLQSWLRAFNFVRNVAAHHARLWNRRSPVTPVLPPLDRCRWLAPLHQAPDSASKLFGLLSCLLLLMRNIAPDNDWLAQLKLQLKTFPTSDLVSLESAGFPSQWEEQPLWK